MPITFSEDIVPEDKELPRLKAYLDEHELDADGTLFASFRRHVEEVVSGWLEKGLIAVADLPKARGVLINAFIETQERDPDADPLEGLDPKAREAILSIVGGKGASAE